MGYRRKIKEKQHSVKMMKRNIHKIMSSSGKPSYGSIHSQCLKKKAYASEREAASVAQVKMGERGYYIRSYHCSFCNFYHLTSNNLY